MRLLEWLRITRTRRTGPRTVTVTLTADTSAFVNAMHQFADHERDLRSALAYRQRILYERILAQAHLGVMLDDWCRSYGWSPSVWRLPLGHSSDRARLNRDLATFRTVKHYELGLELKDPITISGSGA